jgi:hypothetical protein
MKFSSLNFFFSLLSRFRSNNSHLDGTSKKTKQRELPEKYFKINIDEIKSQQKKQQQQHIIKLLSFCAFPLQTSLNSLWAFPRKCERVNDWKLDCEGANKNILSKILPRVFNSKTCLKFNIH